MKTLPFALLATSILFLANCTTASKPYSGSSRPAQKKPQEKALTTTKTILGQPRPGSVIRVRATAYSHQENEAGGKYGRKNAMGTILKYGKVRSAAADWSRFPAGTKFKIIGDPHVYVVEDYGSALVGTNTIDIYKPTLKSMRAWGVRNIDIKILEWGCFKHSLHVLNPRRAYRHCREMAVDIARRVRI